MNRNQFAIYRADLNTDGWRIKGHSYKYVRERNLDVCMANYRQIHLAAMQEKETVKDVMKRIHNAVGNPTLDSVGTSDVLVLNRNGEMICYYLDKERIVPIRNFIRSTNGGNIIDLDTRDYEIEGKAGKWDTFDEIIIDGNFFYLMENQKYRGDASAVVLDAYGKMIAEDVMHGFDEPTKQKIRDSLKQPEIQKKPEPEMVQTERMLIWQKYLQNGTWERRSESGTEANYDMVDGRVNNHPVGQKPVEKEPEKQKSEIQPKRKKKPKKRTSVIRRLHQKQIDIAKRSGKPVPMYLQEAERNNLKW